MQRVVPATEFKAKVLRFLDRAASGDTVVVSKHGQPVAKLVPLEPSDNVRPLEGCIQVVDPGDDLELEVDWEAANGYWHPR